MKGKVSLRWVKLSGGRQSTTKFKQFDVLHDKNLNMAYCLGILPAVSTMVVNYWANDVIPDFCVFSEKKNYQKLQLRKSMLI